MEQKIEITKLSKLMIVGQFIFVIGVFSFVMFFAPSLEYPRNGEVINQNGVEFKFRNANVILIDDNSEFTSPKEINLKESNFSRILFEPGTYYWKAVGLVESSPREFIVESKVGLEIDEENSSIKNVGNMVLDVGLEGFNGIDGLVILDVDVEYGIDLEKEVNYTGTQHEE